MDRENLFLLNRDMLWNTTQNMQKQNGVNTDAGHLDLLFRCCCCLFLVLEAAQI